MANSFKIDRELLGGAASTYVRISLVTPELWGMVRVAYETGIVSDYPRDA